MVKIRLLKAGRKGDPVYRVVATHHTKKNTGKPLEVLGFWHPREDKKQIDKKALGVWIKKGATLSPAVAKLIK